MVNFAAYQASRWRVPGVSLYQRRCKYEADKNAGQREGRGETGDIK